MQYKFINIELKANTREPKQESKKKTRTTTKTIHIQTDKSNEQCEFESVTRPIKWNKINNEEKEKSALDSNQNAEQRGNNTHTHKDYLFCVLFMVRRFILKKTLKSFDKVAKYYIIIICVCVCYVPWYLQSECKRTFLSDKYSHNSFSIF